MKVQTKHDEAVTLGGNTDVDIPVLSRVEPSGKEDIIDASFLDSRGNSHMNTRPFTLKHCSTIHEGTAIFTKGDLLGVKVNPSEWKEIFSLYTTNKNYKKVLPKDWGDRVARFLSERIPYCSIKFKRHKLYSKCSEFVAKF